MNTRFSASESIEIAVEEQDVPVQHYLRQPQRLVQAIANPKLMEQLSGERFRLKMRPLNFMEMYQFQPTVVLRVWSDANGTVNIKSEECEIRGNEYINDRFSLNVTGKLFPTQEEDKTLLQGKADVDVRVELPMPLQLMPKPLLESAGNGLVKSVLLRMKQRLQNQLVKDYQQWASSSAKSQSNSQKSGLSPIENPTT